MNKNWIDNKLYPSERVIFSTRPHWSIFFSSAVLFLLSLTLWWFIFVALIALLYALFIFYSHEFVVTNRRLIEKKGLYYIRLNDWSFEKIDDIICTQAIGDRIWRKGSVIIMGISIRKTRLRNVENPHELKNAVYSQLPTKTIT